MTNEQDGKVFFFLAVIIILIIIGFTTRDEPTHYECLHENRFSYDGECTPLSDIPVKYREEIFYEVADEIAEVRGISKQEAIWELLYRVDWNIQE